MRWGDCVEQPNFWSVIPASVRYDKVLRANAKLIYSEITALSNKQGYCSANNEYFAELYDLSKKTVSDLIAQLAHRGYIKIEVIRNQANQIVARRIWCAMETPFLQLSPIPNNADTYPQKSGYPIPKKTEDIKENKTRKNNTPISPKGARAFEDFAQGNSELLAALTGFEEMRNRKRKPLTDRARTMLLGRLRELAPDDPVKQVKLLDQSTMKCWDTVYPLDADKPAQQTDIRPKQEASKRWVK